MRRGPTAFGLVLALGLAGCGDAVGPEDAALPSAITVGTSGLRSYVEALAHDSMCGRAAGTRYERQAAAYVADRFAAAGLAAGGTDGYYQPITGVLPVAGAPSNAACTADEAFPSRNVIGVLPGLGYLAEEWVVIGAHYDHVGWREGERGIEVFNGADDNASGTAVVVEVARLMAAWAAAHSEATAVRRSIMFQTYGAEEVGLLGSQQFALAPTVPGDSIYAMVNLDMVGWLRDDVLTIAGTGTSTEWAAMLNAARPEGMRFTYDDAALARSDQWSFISLLQTPAVHLFTGLHPEYHTPADDPPLINYEGMARVAHLALGLLWGLATRTASM